MRAFLAVMLTSGLFLSGCGGNASTAGLLGSPAGPTAVTGSQEEGLAEAKEVEVPFHSDLDWQMKAMTPVPEGHCTQTLPDGIVYLWFTHNEGTHVTTHLGAGPYENYLCVYGRIIGGRPAPSGWYAEVIRWTAANGDVLLGTSQFQYWTGTPGQSIAVDTVEFHDGGTGRFQFAQGDGMRYLDVPARTGVYEGTLRYGRKAK